MDLHAFYERLASRLPYFHRRAGAEEKEATDLSDAALSITRATSADVPAMVDMAEAAVDCSPFHQALNSEEAGAAYLRERREITSYFIGRYVEMPDRHFWVARHPATRQVVGFIGFLETPAEDASAEEPGHRVTLQHGGEITKKRTESVGLQLKALVSKHTAGRAHLLCSYLLVLPQHRRQGVSRRLLEHALTQLPDRPALVWPLAARDVFRREGWVEVDALEVDLAEWAGAYRGYGLYRMPLLVRQVAEKPGSAELAAN